MLNNDLLQNLNPIFEIAIKNDPIQSEYHINKFLNNIKNLANHILNIYENDYEIDDLHNALLLEISKTKLFISGVKCSP